MSNNIRVPILLQELQDNEGFREAVEQRFPQIAKSVKQYSLNPFCKCRKEITNFFNENGNDEEVQEFIREWRGKTRSGLSGSEPPKTNIQEENKIVPQKMYGEVLEIPAQPQAYKKLIEHARENMWIYNSVSVMASEKSGQDVWIVFFG